MPSRRRSLIACLALPTSLLADAAVARAQTVEISGAVTAQIWLDVSEIAVDQDGFTDTQPVGPLSGSTLASALGPAESSISCESAADADYGTLRVSLAAFALGDPELLLTPDGNIGSGNASAMFEDYITVVPPEPGLDGSQGTARVRLQISGIVDADGGGSLDSNTHVTYSALVRFGSRNCPSLGIGCSDAIAGTSRDLGSLGGGESYEGTLLPVAFETDPLPFLFGQTFPLGVELGLTAGADADEEQLMAVAIADLANTVSWDGFVEVRNASGDVVEGYSIDSLTGIDWALPVPEPDGASLLAATVLTGLAARRRRGMQARPATEVVPEVRS